MSKKKILIESFDFEEGTILAKKYIVVKKVGVGWEGEVYMTKEINNGIVRAIKCFFPHRNIRNKTSRFYAKKLHKLRNCPVLVHYHTEEQIEFEGQKVTLLVSEYVEGEILSEYFKRQPGKRLAPFQAVHLLHALAKGMDAIHRLGEYHGDLHSQNALIQRYGLGFDLKIFDLFHWNYPKKVNIQDDVIDLIKLFHESLGGQKHYARQPQIVKDICCGLKRSLILKKYRTAGQLRRYLEEMKWE